MSPPVVAIIFGVTLAAVVLLMYKRATSEVYSPQYHRPYSCSGARRSSGCDDVCTICLYSLESENTAVLPCTHKYHKRCIKEWMRTAGKPTPCPSCRHKFDEFITY